MWQSLWKKNQCATFHSRPHLQERCLSLNQIPSFTGKVVRFSCTVNFMVNLSFLHNFQHFRFSLIVSENVSYDEVTTTTKFVRNRDFFCSSVQMIHKNCWCMGVVYKLVLLRLLFEKIIATRNSSKWVVLTRWLFSKNEVRFRLSNFPCGSLIFAMLTTGKGWLFRLYLLSIIYLKISEKVGLS